MFRRQSATPAPARGQPVHTPVPRSRAAGLPIPVTRKDRKTERKRRPISTLEMARKAQTLTPRIPAAKGAREATAAAGARTQTSGTITGKRLEWPRDRVTEERRQSLHACSSCSTAAQESHDAVRIDSSESKAVRSVALSGESLPLLRHSIHPRRRTDVRVKERSCEQRTHALPQRGIRRSQSPDSLPGRSCDRLCLPLPDQTRFL